MDLRSRNFEDMDRSPHRSARSPSSPHRSARAVTIDYDLLRSFGLFFVLSGFLFAVIGTIVASYFGVRYSFVAFIICVVAATLCSLCLVILFHIYGRHRVRQFLTYMHSRTWYLTMVITSSERAADHYFSHGFWDIGPLFTFTYFMLVMYIVTVYATYEICLHVLCADLYYGVSGFTGFYVVCLLCDLIFHRGRAWAFYGIWTVAFSILRILDCVLIWMMRRQLIARDRRIPMIARDREDARLLPF